MAEARLLIVVGHDGANRSVHDLRGSEQVGATNTDMEEAPDLGATSSDEDIGAVGEELRDDVAPNPDDKEDNSGDNPQDNLDVTSLHND